MENAYLVYILKVSLSLVVLSLIYYSFFRNDTLNKLRRYFLLFIILFSIIFPFLQFDFLPHETDTFIYQLNLAQVEVTPVLSNTSDAVSLNFQLFFVNLLMIVCAMLFIRFIIQLVGVLSMIYKGKTIEKDGYKIVCINQAITPFSFFNRIFIRGLDNDTDDLKLMIKHEQAHVRQKHSLDIIIAELFCIAFWWNPIAWLLRKEIKVNIEYLADNEVINNGIDMRQYQYLLLQTIQNNASIYIINDFNVSQLKKRITMINKHETSRIFSIKYLLIIPIVVFLIVANATAKNVVSSVTETVVSDEIQDKVGVKELKEGGDDKNNPFTAVEVMPQFPGGEKALMAFISENLKYPEAAIKDKREGRVIIRFTIQKSGQISDIKAIRSLCPECDAEAIRVVEAMPKWRPGKQNGKYVSVYYTLPIIYKLTKENTDSES